MAVAPPNITPGFTPEDSACRLRRVQLTVAALTPAVDGVLFLGGVDGKNALGSVHGLNYVLGGVHQYELLEKQSLAHVWLEDVVLWITPDSVDIHVSPDAYELIRQFAAVWARTTNVTVRALPPRRVAAAQREADERVEAKREQEQRRRMMRMEGGDVSDTEDEQEDDDENTQRPSSESSDDYFSEDDSESDSDEDAAQDFKLESFVETLTGVKSIAIALVEPYDDLKDSNAKSLKAQMAIEQWPLVQAYGLEGIGRGGFFTMNFFVTEIGEALKKKCYTKLDAASLMHEMQHNVSQFTRHWNETVEQLGEVSSVKRLEFIETQKSTERETWVDSGWFSPLVDFFEYGSMRDAFGVKPVDTKKDAPRICMTTSHGTLEASHPKSPGLRCARTLFFRNGSRGIAQRNGFVDAQNENEHTETEDENEETENELAATLAAVHAGVLAAVRVAANACFDVAGTKSGVTTVTKETAKETARTAFVDAATEAGLSEEISYQYSEKLLVEATATSPSRDVLDVTDVSNYTDCAFVYVRAEVAVDENTVPVVHGDVYVCGGYGKDPVGVTTNVPTANRYPSVFEAEICDETNLCVQRIIRDKKNEQGKTCGGGVGIGIDKQKGKQTEEKETAVTAGDPTENVTDENLPGSSKNPLAEISEPKTSQDDFFLDDDLVTSSEDEEDDGLELKDSLHIASDDDEDQAEYNYRFTLDQGLKESLGTLVVASKKNASEKVLAFHVFHEQTRQNNKSYKFNDSDITTEAFRETCLPETGAKNGEWFLFEGGVVFMNKNAPPVVLTLGGNVEAIDVCENFCLDQCTLDLMSRNSGTINDNSKHSFGSGTVVVCRVREECAPSLGPLFGVLGILGSLEKEKETLSICFSLATLSPKSRRRFWRVVLPRWRGLWNEGLGSININRSSEQSVISQLVKTIPLLETKGVARVTQLALANARADSNESSTLSALSFGFGNPGIGMNINFSSNAVCNALKHASEVDAQVFESVEAERSSERSEEHSLSSENSDSNQKSKTVVPAVLLTGPFDGCQSVVFQALAVGAPGSAYWIEATLPFEVFGGGLRIDKSAFEVTLSQVTDQVESALEAASVDSSGTINTTLPSPCIVFVVRTYRSATQVAKALQEALRLFSYEYSSRKNTSYSFELKNITSCVSASGFFTEAERRVNPNAVSQLNGADVVVALPSSTMEHSSEHTFIDGYVDTLRRQSVEGKSVNTSELNDSDAETQSERHDDCVKWIQQSQKVELIATRTRLRRDPLACVPYLFSDREGAVGVDARSPVISWSTDLPLTGRRVVATGALNLSAVLKTVRNLFKSSRKPPAPSAETLSGLGPTARLERQLVRFREMDLAHDMNDHVFRVKHALVKVTSERVNDDGENKKKEIQKTFAFNFFTAAPFDLDGSGMGKQSEGESDFVTSVEVFVTGIHVDKFNLPSLLAGCGDRGPKNAVLKTVESLTLKEMNTLESELSNDENVEMPTGWYHDGVKWVDFDGQVSFRHPCFLKRCEAFVAEENERIQSKNEKRATLRDATPKTEILVDETVVQF